MNNPILQMIRRCQRIAELKRLVAEKEEQARFAALHAERVLSPVFRARAEKVARINQAQADRYKRELEGLRKGGLVDVRA